VLANCEPFASGENFKTLADTIKALVVIVAPITAESERK